MQRALLALVAVCMLLACREARVPSTVQINEAAASHTTEVHKGDRLEITLAENVTTGYRWTVDSSSCAGTLALDSDQAARPEGAPPGAGGHRTWAFTAQQEGGCALHFRYARPWEKEATGTTLVFPVAVKAS